MNLEVANLGWIAALEHEGACQWDETFTFMVFFRSHGYDSSPGSAQVLWRALHSELPLKRYAHAMPTKA